MSTSVSINDVVKSVVGEMARVAGQQWKEISSASINESKILAARLKQIATGYARGELNEEDARDFFAMVLNNMTSMIAMATAMIWAAVKKIVDAAIAAISGMLNKAVGFTLL